jgi:hypothetical protein
LVGLVLVRFISLAFSRGVLLAMLADCFHVEDMTSVRRQRCQTSVKKVVKGNEKGEVDVDACLLKRRRRRRRRARQQKRAFLGHHESD